MCQMQDCCQYPELSPGCEKSQAVSLHKPSMSTLICTLCLRQAPTFAITSGRAAEHLISHKINQSVVSQMLKSTTPLGLIPCEGKAVGKLPLDSTDAGSGP
ncbi:hypothetical protein KIL84_001142 [Mauremys mutica]|uniref:Uncharacterized protein n=1 Tax=Mauremys mutica TaxID=74926 RepID=A0A9D4AP09_9SAUR|nr:hypothetical protein KIL84_001142 [Mauremys mutica]